MSEGFCVYNTKFGPFKIGYENDTVIFVKKILPGTNYGKPTDLTDTVYTQLCEYFEGKRKLFNFAYTLVGTDFQKKVWQALVTIPYGETRTYKDIAKQIGNEKASRAVGLANNKNPITIAVPCHRVIGSNGRLVGYAGGLEMKKALLSLEQKNSGMF